MGRALLRFFALLTVIMGGLVALFSATQSAAAAGHTGQALALQALLHPGKSAANSFLAQRPRFQRLPNGRILLPNSSGTVPARKAHATGGAPTIISEGVQTFDVFSPPPAFQTALPTGPLTPTNLFPVWSSDERYLVFSSNRSADGKGVAADGNFHIYAVTASGGTVTQITTGTGSEFYPALNVGNSALAFTSNVLTPGTQNLFIIGGQSGVAFSPGNPAVDVGTLTSANNEKTFPNNEFGNVQRPTWSPGSDRLAFSATTLASGTHTPGVNHIYYLYVANNGYQAQPAPGIANPPAALTNGPGNDTDPAWSPSGRYIAFASTATAIANSGQQISPTTAPTTTSGGAAGGQRGIYLINGGVASAFGTVALAGGGPVTAPGTDDFAPAWSANTQNQYFNPNGTLEYLAFARGLAQTSPHDIYYFRLTDLASGSAAPITPETVNGNNNAVQLNTDDNAGQQGTGSAANAYDDTYPTWAPFSSVFSIAYQSPRSVTYNVPVSNTPLETALSLGQGNAGVGPNYVGILESQVVNLDPPTLLRYNGNQVVRVQNDAGNETRNIQPSVPGGLTSVTFTVRLSNREAGIDDNKVFLQLKDPDSKYQDSQGLEHKVFVGLNEGLSDSRTARIVLPNVDARDFAIDPMAAQAGLFAIRGAGVNVIGTARYPQYGAVGGADGNDTISVGHGGTLDTYLPWGQEYECQFVNPTIANPGIGATDYGTPYYLAGVDDQRAFSGLANPPRPTADTTVTNPNNTTTTTPAQYLPLTRLPDAQQDGQGGVLYGAKYQTPASPSDFYVDVIAYDKAVFPAIQPFPNGNGANRTDYHGNAFNWRIYDNVGGFTTATFDGSNDILVVSDNALGQKFAATTFGGRGNNGANLLPTFYGAESYFTDIDVSLLPNAVDFTATNKAPTPPPIPRPDPAQATPTQVSATPGTAQVTVEWSGVVVAPGTALSYNIYSSQDPNNIPTGPGATPIGTASGTTSFVDRGPNNAGLTNGVTYYYVVTAVTGTPPNESNPSTPPMAATPQDFAAGPTHISQYLSSARNSGFSRFQPNVLNGLGVGSYLDGNIDDGGRVSAVGANMPTDVSSGNPNPVVPFVRSQKYSIWRILSRGAIPQTVLAAYQPTFEAQPAVADATNKVNFPAAPNVTVATRCVIWISPYTGDLPLIDAGSLENPNTQNTLTAFVQSGGRFFLSGQDVVNALTLGGSTANTFVSGVLNAAYASDAGGTTSLSGAGGRISGDSSINIPVNRGEEVFNSTPAYVTGTGLGPSGGPLLLSNDQPGNQVATPPNWRSDASLGQLGPQPVNFGGAIAVGRIDTISALNNATVDMMTGGSPGLIYNSDFTSAVNKGFGSRIVFASFGFEGIGIEYYKVTIGSTSYYVPRNQRPNLLHNVVSFLRTGTFAGRITQASGLGVAGATVYLVPSGGTVPGPRQTFSATTDFNGNYRINGVETGQYSVAAYKSGFTTSQTSVRFPLEGDNTVSVSLVIAPTPPGQIKGTVTGTDTKPISGVAITFVSIDKQTTVSAVSGPDGTYTIDNVPAGSYTGTASKKPQYMDAMPVQGNPIVVPSGGTAPADFVLTAQPATLTGTVFSDANGNGVLDSGEAGIGGATVSLTTSTAGATAPAAVTTAADGTYSITGIGPGTYTLSVSKNGFLTNSTLTLTIAAGDQQTRNVPLVQAPAILNGTLGGLVQTTFGNGTLGGVTVTITPVGSNTPAATVTTTDTTSSPAAPGGDGQPLNYGPVTLPPGNYSVTIQKGGYGTQSIATLTVSSGVFTRADFTQANGLALSPIHVFNAGLNFFSVPYDFSGAGVGFDSLFGTLNTGTRAAPSPSNANRSHVFAYDPTQLQYVLDPTPPADSPRLGQGYWVFLLNASAVTSPANVPGVTTVAVALKQGWNMIGVPSLNPISISGQPGLQFPNVAGGQSLDFSTAASSAYRLVSGTLYGYNGSVYVPVTASGTLQPWQAYWIYAYVNTTVLIPTR